MPLHIDPPVATIIAAFIAAFAGSIIGPIILRQQRKGDTALEERRKWTKEKLRVVFHEENDQSTDDINFHSAGMIPWNPWVKWHIDMHSIHPRLAESLDLRLLQPRRSKLAYEWLEAWAWVLWDENQALRDIVARDTEYMTLMSNAKFMKLANDYTRHFRGLETALTLWSLGIRPSIRLWFSLKFVAPWARSNRPRKIVETMADFNPKPVEA